jgi:outer membrane protein
VVAWASISRAISSVSAERARSGSSGQSGGPRLSLASRSYDQAYYGVNLSEAIASGLSPSSPGGGLKSVGVGGALTWKTTDKITTSAFAEYSRLMGPAARSSLVRERGSRDQLMLGVSATYRFDFTL